MLCLMRLFLELQETSVCNKVFNQDIFGVYSAILSMNLGEKLYSLWFYQNFQKNLRKTLFIVVFQKNLNISLQEAAIVIELKASE